MTEKPRETQAESHVVELKEKVNNSSLMKHRNSSAQFYMSPVAGRATTLAPQERWRSGRAPRRWDEVGEDFIKSMKPNRLGRHSGLLPSTIR